MIKAPIDRTIHWQTRALCCRYLWVQFEALPLQVRDAGAARDQVAHWALGVLADGDFEVVGVWLAPTSGLMRWPEVFDDLAVRGVEKIRFVASSEPTLMHSAYPGAVALPSMGKLLQQSLDDMAPRDQAPAAEALGAIRGAGTARAARAALTGLEDGPSGRAYPAIVERWRDTLDQLGPLYALPPHFRRIVRSGDAAFWKLHRSVSRAIHKHGCFADRKAAASFVGNWLSRAEFLGGQESNHGSRVEYRVAGMNRSSGISAARL